MADEGETLKVALRLAALGWPAFPLNPYRPGAPKERDSKTPHFCLGKEAGHRKATTDEAQLTEWFSEYPDAGVGVYLGAGGLIAIDVDTKPGAVEFLAELQAKYGELEPGAIQLTPSGGRHLIFRAPPDCHPPGKVHGNKGLDLKYNGYICVYPTRHPAEGKRYGWLRGRGPRRVEDLPEIPAWVMQRVDKLANGALTVTDDDAFIEDTPPVGFSFERMRSVLGYVPNDDDAVVDYDTWEFVLAGIWHEKQGSDEARELAYWWSSQSSKHTDEKFNKTWRSLDHRGKGVAPVTFRYVMNLAKPLREKDIEAAASDAEWKLYEATTGEELEAACKAFKRLELPLIEREQFIALVQIRYLAITGVKLSLPNARRMLRYEQPEGAPKPPILADIIHLAALNVMWRVGTEQTWSKDAFNSSLGRHFMTPQERAEGAVLPSVTPWDAALNRHLIPTVANRMYLPGHPQFFRVNGMDYVNSFDPASIPLRTDKAFTVEEQAAVDRVEKHFHFLCGAPEQAEILLSWLASIVQTMQRADWAPIIQSPEALGKSFTAVLMGAVLGNDNVHLISPDLLEEKFTSWGEGSLLNIVPEMKLHGHNRYDVLNKVKAYITDDFVPIRRMNTNPYKVINTASYLIFTNYRDALPIGLNDTRYYMIAHPDQRKDAGERFKQGNPRYFGDLYAAVDEHPAALREWLHRYPLHPKFNRKGRAPFSPEKAYVAELNKSDDDLALEDALDRPTRGDRTELLFNATDWNAERAISGTALATRALAKVLTDAGFVQLARIRNGDGRVRYWTRCPTRWPTDPEALLTAVKTFLADGI